MSKENGWKSFGQLLSSPSTTWGKPSRKKNVRKCHNKALDKQIARSKYSSHMIDFKIDDASDEEVAEASTHNREENEKLHFSNPSSMALSINPAEVTMDRRNLSGSEIEDVSEDEPCEENASSSEESGSDDCTAIHCKRSKMTRLSFGDKSTFKRRRVTDDMEVTISTEASKSKHGHKEVASMQCFKQISLHRTTASSSGTSRRTTDQWKVLDKSFSEQDFNSIEDLSLSPEECDLEDNRKQQDLLNIEELPPSIQDTAKTSADPAAASATTFYVAPPTSKLKYPKGSALATLSNALAEKNSKFNFWRHELMSGIIHPVSVVKVDSLERSYGRVLLRFYTTEESGGEEKRIENVVLLDPADKQLKTVRAGMEIALEADERIPPHRVSPQVLVYLGVAKLCPMEGIFK